MWNSKDFEAVYSPKSINDIVYPNEYSKTLIEQLVTGARLGHFQLLQASAVFFCMAFQVLAKALLLNCYLTQLN